MCGICGIIDFQRRGQVAPGTLRAMADAMTHRGPDDSGVYVNPDHNVGLGFRRLSIVDLAGGHQPMANEEGSCWIVFNGEIYNHATLRPGLETKGHRYKTRSDTETILHLYEEQGEDCVDSLIGMFAFAIWDQKKRRLLLARDRIGIKPLYYTVLDGRLLFASEIKAILAYPGVPRQVDMEALSLYLSFGAAPAPKTLFKGISKLPAGHRLIVQEDGATTLEQYWDAVFPADGYTSLSEEECVQEVRRLFTQSIQRRMMSDVPFGVFLSGGLDSSFNVALMSQMMDRPVDTFSVAVQDDARSDERQQARAVADHFCANHHEVIITPRDFVDLLPRMAWHQDEPLADPVCVPLYHLAKLARDNGVIVVQVGEGSDELFCGYRDYTRQMALGPYYAAFSALPGVVKTPVAALGARLLSRGRALYLQRAAKGAPLFWGGVDSLPETTKEAMLNGHGSNDLALAWLNDTYKAREATGGKGGLLDRMTYLELKHRLPELLLMRVDKMTMANSIEARVPYLDHELVRFALSIPPRLKFKDGQTKYILKKAARGIVPDWVIHRSKAGFCGSASNMVQAPLVDAAVSLVQQDQGLRDLMDWQPLLDLCRRNRDGDTTTGYHIWMLLNLAMWHSLWIQGQEPDQVARWLGTSVEART
ncbi:MAG: asparagine synthase (glutamine-hydrolyzing) [Chloroflexi bacterium]|nr:asparagine synthase (glutamine-hydrolyzing) [Chloroflexota bacterium]